MTGMLKPKEYKIADSNLALFGTDIEKNVKKAAAEHEKQWEHAGKQVGLQVWHIENFKVVPVQQRDYGHFFTNDSYIVLRTFKKDAKSEKLSYDVHFWLGTTTSQDESGTAAYKTVELDDVLGGAPVQHREIEGHESSLFLSYFSEKGGMRILEGGVASGFHHVEAEKYTPRLFWIKGRKNVRVVEVPMSYKSLNSGDVFLLDAGLTLYQWNGAKSSAQERSRAGQLARALDEERKSAPKLTVFSEGDKDDKPFWDALGGKGTIASDAVAGTDEAWEKESSFKALYRLSDAKGTMNFKLEAREGEGSNGDFEMKEEVKAEGGIFSCCFSAPPPNKWIVKGKVEQKLLDGNDVFIFDVGHEVYLWVGKNASLGEKKHGLRFASDYLVRNKRPNWLPLTRVFDGHEPHIFLEYFSK